MNTCKKFAAGSPNPLMETRDMPKLYRVITQTTNSLQPEGRETHWKTRVIYCGYNRDTARKVYHRHEAMDHTGYGGSCVVTRDCTVIGDAGTDKFSDDLPIQGPKTPAEADSGMERLTIEIKTGSAAFKDKPNELADILRGVSDMANPNLPPALTNRTIFDSNGNRVGRITVVGRH